MTLWTKLIAAGLLLAVLSGLALLYGNAREETGRMEERATQQAAHIAWQREFDKIKAESALRLAKAEAEIHKARKQTDEKVREILQRDSDARAWFDTRVPGAWADLIWLRDSGPVSSVPGGHEPGPRFDITGSTKITD